jgi:hypothetical protein
MHVRGRECCSRCPLGSGESPRERCGGHSSPRGASPPGKNVLALGRRHAQVPRQQHDGRVYAGARRRPSVNGAAHSLRSDGRVDGVRPCLSHTPPAWHQRCKYQNRCGEVRRQPGRQSVGELGSDWYCQCGCETDGGACRKMKFRSRKDQIRGVHQPPSESQSPSGGRTELLPGCPRVAEAYQEGRLSVQSPAGPHR